MSTNQDQSIVIRQAGPADVKALEALAQRDSAAMPSGAVLVAETGGALRAAVRLDGGPSIADPFHPTTDLLALLEARAGQLRSRRRRATRIVARTPAAAPAHAIGRRALA
jgi:hypothetical protein